MNCRVPHPFALFAKGWAKDAAQNDWNEKLAERVGLTAVV